MGAFPGYADNRDAMLRVIRNHRRAAHSETAGYEGLSIRPQPLDAANCPDAPLVEAAKRAWDKALSAGRAARLPQRPGLGHRAHRHDRPGDGLRHHRHRTRLRPGEVQEAGRRRLLQDHQSHRPAGARDAGLRRGGRSSASSPTPSAMARSPERPRSITRRLAARGFDPGDHRACGKVDRDLLRHPLRLLALHLGRSLLPQRARSRRRSARRSQARRADRASDSPRAMSPLRTFMRAGR